MVVTLQKFPFDSEDDELVDRLAKQFNVHRYIIRQMSGNGTLLGCKDCLECYHFAPWRTRAEIEAVSVTFKSKHTGKH